MRTCFFFYVDHLVFVSHSMGLGELVEVRSKEPGHHLTQIELTTHRAPRKEGRGEQPGRESIFSQAITATGRHMPGYASDRGDQLSDHLEASHFLGRPVDWKPRDAPIGLIIS